MKGTSRIGAVAALALMVAAGVLLGTPIGQGSEAEPSTPIPRVCWYSDYEQGKLANQCHYEGGLWYMEVEGETVPAHTQPMPEANLCHYFHGTSCPDPEERKKCMSCRDE